MKFHCLNILAKRLKGWIWYMKHTQKTQRHPLNYNSIPGHLVQFVKGESIILSNCNGPSGLNSTTYF